MPHCPRPRRLAAFLIVAAQALTLAPGAPVGPVAAATGPSAGDLGVSLVGSFDGIVRLDSIPGLASPVYYTPGGETSQPANPFQFQVTCAAVCDGGQLVVDWDFGDGATSSSGGLDTTHSYDQPGVYEVVAKVRKGTEAAGMGRIKAVVAPQYADVVTQAELDDAAPANTTPRAADATRAAMWTIGALGLLPSCRPALSVSGGTVTSGKIGQALFCTDPTDATYNKPDTDAVPTNTKRLNAQVQARASSLSANVTPLNPALVINGVTGQNCATSAATCDLPVRIFAGAAGGNLTAPCSATCQSQLVTLGYAKGAISKDGTGYVELAYDPTRCGDDWTAAEYASGWERVGGVESGCVSRGDFYVALVRAVDGVSAQGSSVMHLASANTACPGDAAELPTGEVRTAVLRASALGILVNRERLLVGGVQAVKFCDVNASITKGEAYRTIAKLTGAPSYTPSARDLSDANLGGAGTEADQFATQYGAVLGAGGPMVGDTSCADNVSTGFCFNAEERLTRKHLAVLLADLLVGPERIAGSLVAEGYVDNDEASVGAPISVRVKATVPTWLPAGSQLAVTWPTVSGTTRRCPSDVTAGGVQTRTGDPGEVVVFACKYLANDAGTSSVQVTVSTPNRVPVLYSQTVVVPFTTTNRGPRLGNHSFDTTPEEMEGTSGQEDAPRNLSVLAYDPEGQSLKYRVRSCASVTAGGECYQTGSWGTSVTYGLGTLAFDSVVTDNGIGWGTGTVSGGSEYVQLRLTQAANKYGRYNFEVQACDPAGVKAGGVNTGGCATRTYTDRLFAVNDPPLATTSAGGSVTLATLRQRLAITLGANDDVDSLEPGYPAGAKLTYTITQKPIGGDVYLNTSIDPAVRIMTRAENGSQSTDSAIEFEAWMSTWRPTAVTFKYTATDQGYSELVNEPATSAEKTVTVNIPPAPTPKALEATIRPNESSDAEHRKTTVAFDPLDDPRVRGYWVYRLAENQSLSIVDETVMVTNTSTGITAPWSSELALRHQIAASTQRMTWPLESTGDSTSPVRNRIAYKFQYVAYNEAGQLTELSKAVTLVPKPPRPEALSVSLDCSDGTCTSSFNAKYAAWYELSYDMAQSGTATVTIGDEYMKNGVLVYRDDLLRDGADSPRSAKIGINTLRVKACNWAAETAQCTTEVVKTSEYRPKPTERPEIYVYGTPGASWSNPGRCFQGEPDGENGMLDQPNNGYCYTELRGSLASRFDTIEFYVYGGHTANDMVCPVVQYTDGAAGYQCPGDQGRSGPASVSVSSNGSVVTTGELDPWQSRLGAEATNARAGGSIATSNVGPGALGETFDSNLYIRNGIQARGCNAKGCGPWAFYSAIGLHTPDPIRNDGDTDAWWGGPIDERDNSYALSRYGVVVNNADGGQPPNTGVDNWVAGWGSYGTAKETARAQYHRGDMDCWTTNGTDSPEGSGRGTAEPYNDYWRPWYQSYSIANQNFCKFFLQAKWATGFELVRWQARGITECSTPAVNVVMNCSDLSLSGAARSWNRIEFGSRGIHSAYMTLSYGFGTNSTVEDNLTVNRYDTLWQERWWNTVTNEYSGNYMSSLGRDPLGGEMLAFRAPRLDNGSYASPAPGGSAPDRKKYPNAMYGVVSRLMASPSNTAGGNFRYCWPRGVGIEPVLGGCQFRDYVLFKRGKGYWDNLLYWSPWPGQDHYNATVGCDSENPNPRDANGNPTNLVDPDLCYDAGGFVSDYVIGLIYQRRTTSSNPYNGDR